MKHILLLSALLCATGLSAQDKIVKFDNSILESKVLEISDTAIKYKRFDNPDGPVYTTSRKEIAVIIFQNGTVEVMQHNPPASYEDYKIKRKEERRQLVPYRNTIASDVFGMIPGVNSFNAFYGISSMNILYERRNKSGIMANQVSFRLLYLPQTAGSFYAAFQPKIFFNKHKIVRAFAGPEVALGFIHNYADYYNNINYYGEYYYTRENLGYFHAAPHFGINLTPVEKFTAIFDFGVGFMSTYNTNGIFQSSVYWKVGAALGGMF